MNTPLLHTLLGGGLAALALSASAQRLVSIRMEKSGTGTVCKINGNLFDYAGCTNYLNSSEDYDGKMTFVFMGIASDMEVKYVTEMLTCLRNTGFKGVFLDCDTGEGDKEQRLSPWSELPLWFFAPENLGNIPIVATFDTNKLGLVTFHAWEKTYVPRSIEDAVETIKNNLTSVKKDQLQKMSTAQLRYENSEGLGKWMRVNWVLWEKNSRLSHALHKKQAYFPDEKSWVVLNLLQRTLKGERVDYSGDFTKLAKSSSGAVEEPLK